MGNRLSKIYTRTGDDGSTGLSDGSRVSKANLRVEALGTVDELNSLLGVLVSTVADEEICACLLAIQHHLFDLGGELSMPGVTQMESSRIDYLEQILDSYNNKLPALKEFILPGGSQAAAHCHLARTVCRRAERRLVELAVTEPVNPVNRAYLNRLSDLLFVLARVIARADGGQEILWNHQRGEPS